MGVTDSSGTKVNSYDYDPFGVMLNQQEGVANPFKFAGGYLDASGFEQFGVRYYSPSLGRWTQQDPVAGSLFDLNSANRYVYAGDDPVNQVDPGGTSSCFVTFINDISGIFFVTTVFLLGIQLIGLTIENPLVFVTLEVLYLLYATPILVVIYIAEYNDIAQACNWPLVKFAG